MKALLTFVAAVLLLGAGALLSGAYNISARDPHWDVTLEVLALGRDRSIAVHSEGTRVPPLNNPQLPAAGGIVYSRMCVICHGAPGVFPDPFSQGLYPAPANLLSGQVQKQWSDAQLYWIVENGLKLTGMPAFGDTLEPAELPAVMAFLRKLPDLDAGRYAEIVAKAGVQGR